MQTIATEEGAVSFPQKNAGNILLAADSAVYRHMIGSHLNEWGFDFVCARDGNTAWNLLMEPDAPRLALIDWMLPETEGVDLCRRLRNRPGHEPYTYTILLTGKSRKQEMLEAMDAGADDFFAKPFDPLELKARLLVGKRIVELQQKLISAKNARCSLRRAMTSSRGPGIAARFSPLCNANWVAPGVPPRPWESYCWT